MWQGTNLVVTVLKAGGNPLVPVSTIVHYTLVQGTATLDEDVAALTGSITIGATETSKAFNVPIVDDDVPEGPETFTISLTLDPSTAGYATLTPGAMTVTIPTNDDAAGVFGFAPGSLLVSVAPPSVGSDPRSVNLEVTRTRGTVGAAAVFWFIGEDGADTAFAVASGTINFADGQDTGTIDLGVEPSSSAHFVKPFTVQLVSQGAQCCDCPPFRRGMHVWPPLPLTRQGAGCGSATPFASCCSARRLTPRCCPRLSPSPPPSASPCRLCRPRHQHGGCADRSDWFPQRRRRV